MKVGKRIREIRTSKGISGVFLANKLGIHPSTLGKYESGERKVDADFLPKVAEALGVDVGIFFTQEVDISSTPSDEMSNKFKHQSTA